MFVWEQLVFLSDKGGLRVVNIFKDSLDVFGLYLKMIRINELQRSAQDLGAKHFKVTYKEERTSFSERVSLAESKI